MSERINVEEAFNPELREEINQAQQDFDAYMDSRPFYQDTQGRFRDSETGKPVKQEMVDAHFDEQRNAHFESTAAPAGYEDMPASALAKKLGEAYHNNDRTAVEEIIPVLDHKIGDAQEQAMSERDTEHNADRAASIHDRIYGIAEKRLDELQAADVAPKADEARKSESTPESESGEPKPSETQEPPMAEAKEDDLSDLKDEAGVNAIKEANTIIKQADRESRLLTEEEQAKLARARAAMDKFGLHGKVKWHEMKNVSERDDHYKALQAGGLQDEAGKESRNAAEPSPENAEEQELSAGKELVHVPRDEAEATPRNWRQRFANKFRDARDKLFVNLKHNTDAFAQKQAAYLNDPEKGKGRRTRRYIMAAAIGAGLVGLGMWARQQGVELDIDANGGDVIPPHEGGSITDGTHPEGTPDVDSDATAEIDEVEPWQTEVDTTEKNTITHSIQDRAGKGTLDGGQIWRVYLGMEKAGYITPEYITGVGLYEMADGHMGYSGPGTATFDPEAVAHMDELIREELEKAKSNK